MYLPLSLSLSLSLLISLSLPPSLSPPSPGYFHSGRNEGGIGGREEGREERVAIAYSEAWEEGRGERKGSQGRREGGKGRKGEREASFHFHHQKSRLGGREGGRER